MSENLVIGGRTRRTWTWFLWAGLGASLLSFFFLRERLRPIASGPVAEAELRLDDPAAYFSGEGFVRLEPPIRLPGRAGGKNRTEIFLRLPKSERLRLEPGVGAAGLSYPPGSYAARVESVLTKTAAGRKWLVADIRATRFTDAGRIYEVYRRASRADDAPLIGVEWRAGDSVGQKRADDWIERASRLGVPERAAARVSRKAVQDNACGGCHVAQRPEASRVREFGSVHRGTDAGGLFVPATMLRDDAPVELYAPLEQNRDDPRMRFRCPAGEVRWKREGDGPERPKCASGAVPRAEFDVRGALDDGDPRARSVCRGRLALLELLAPGDRSQFADVEASCRVRD